MKRLSVILVAAAAAFATVQDAFAKPVRLREAAPGEGLEVHGARSGVKAGKSPLAAGSAHRISAVDAAASLSEALGVTITQDELAIRRDDVDALGRRHVRLRQVYRGVEVDGRELIVHFGSDGRVYEVNGDWLDDLSLDVTPALQVEGATLVVFCKGDDAAAARLAWKKRTGRDFIFTDAMTGETLHVRAAGPRHAQANSRASTQTDQGREDDSAFTDYLILKATTMDLPEGIATTLTGNLPIQQGGEFVEIGATLSTDGKTYLTTTKDGVEIGIIDGYASPKYRAGTAEAYATDDEEWLDWFINDTWWTAYSEDPEEDMSNAFAIIHNIGLVLDYCKTAFGRLSYDARGGRVAAWRFWQYDMDDLYKGFDNAYWDTMAGGAANTNGCFFFGYDLSGAKSVTALDICAHEFTHGITSWSADLIYEGESGALNESFSDLIAAAVEFNFQPRAADVENPGPGEADWLFYEDSGEPARSYANPQLYGSPSRYKGTNWVDASDTSPKNDNGGVHDNSGVQNHFFYLLCEGGKGRNDGVEYDLKGIGIDKAAQLAYHALTAYCVPHTDYTTIQQCWDSAARDLLESGVLTEADYEAVEPAWMAVLSAPNSHSCGETVYANENGLLVKIGAPNAKGVSRITLMIALDNGKVVKLSGKMQGDEAVLTKRGVGSVTITLSPNSAIVTLDDAKETVPRVSPLVNAIKGLEDLRVGVAFEQELELDEVDEVMSLRWSGKKLPPGVKVVSKNGTIAGVPKKAGRGKGRVEAKCKFLPVAQKKPVTAKVAREVEWQVVPLDAWAQGKFSADGVDITISKNGRIKGNVIVNGRKTRISAKSYAAFADGKYIAADKINGGSFVFTVTESGLSGMLILGSTTIPISATR